MIQFLAGIGACFIIIIVIIVILEIRGFVYRTNSDIECLFKLCRDNSNSIINLQKRRDLK